jgi:hypothetical protein
MQGNDQDAPQQEEVSAEADGLRLDAVTDMWNADDRAARRVAWSVLAILVAVLVALFRGRVDLASAWSVMACVGMLLGAFMTANMIAGAYKHRRAWNFVEAKKRGHTFEVVGYYQDPNGELLRKERYVIDGHEVRATYVFCTSGPAHRKGIVEMFFLLWCIFGAITAVLVAPLFALLTKSFSGALFLLGFGLLPLLVLGALLLWVEVSHRSSRS